MAQVTERPGVGLPCSETGFKAYMMSGTPCLPRRLSSPLFCVGSILRKGLPSHCHSPTSKLPDSSLVGKRASSISSCRGPESFWLGSCDTPEPIPWSLRMQSVDWLCPWSHAPTQMTQSEGGRVRLLGKRYCSPGGQADCSGLES